MRGVELEVDDRELAAGLESAGESARVGDAVTEVVPHVDHEHAIDGVGRELRIVGWRLHGAQVRQVLARRSLGEVADHVGLDVGRDHLPLGDGARESHGEVPGAGTDVGDGHLRREPERSDHAIGLLPGIARGIVEDLRPPVGVVEPVRHVAVMRVVAVVGMVVVGVVGVVGVLGVLGVCRGRFGRTTAPDDRGRTRDRDECGELRHARTMTPKERSRNPFSWKIINETAMLHLVSEGVCSVICPMEAATLAVIGAGPKAAALAARIAALHAWRTEHPVAAASLRPPPRLQIFERSARPGAHWYGDDGYTDGAQQLCTPPERDLVDGASELGATLELEPYAWATFATERSIEAAVPTHRQLADYIAWAIERAAARAGGGIVLHTGAEVIRMRSDGVRWRLGLLGASRDLSTRFDGVIVTSPGPANRRFHVDAAIAARVADARTYWAGHRAPVRRCLARGSRVAVVGAGGAAAAICVDALQAIEGHADPGGIVIVAPQPTLFTRGDSRYENQVLTDPTVWSELPRVARRQVAEHLISGVVFRRVLDQLEGLEHVPAFLPARAIAAVPHGNAIALWCLTLDERMQLLEVDRVVDASGFDPLWFAELLEEPARTIARRLGTPVLADRIDRHLRLVVDAGMYDDPTVRETLIAAQPGLHVPFLAGGSRPPGRASLLQLGTMAEEILAPYLVPG